MFIRFTDLLSRIREGFFLFIYTFTGRFDPHLNVSKGLSFFLFGCSFLVACCFSMLLAFMYIETLYTSLEAFKTLYPTIYSLLGDLHEWVFFLAVCFAILLWICGFFIIEYFVSFVKNEKLCMFVGTIYKYTNYFFLQVVYIMSVLFSLAWIFFPIIALRTASSMIWFSGSIVYILLCSLVFFWILKTLYVYSMNRILFLSKTEFSSPVLYSNTCLHIIPFYVFFIIFTFLISAFYIMCSIYVSYILALEVKLQESAISSMLPTKPSAITSGNSSSAGSSGSGGGDSSTSVSKSGEKGLANDGGDDCGDKCRVIVGVGGRQYDCPKRVGDALVKAEHFKKILPFDGTLGDLARKVITITEHGTAQGLCNDPKSTPPPFTPPTPPSPHESFTGDRLIKKFSK